MTTLQIVTMLAAAVVFFTVEPLLNRMQSTCGLLIRSTYSGLLVIAAGIILFVSQGYQPPVWLSVVLAAIAALLLCRTKI